MYCIICDETFTNQKKHNKTEEHEYYLIYHSTWLVFKDIYDINVRYQFKNFDIFEIYDLLNKKKKRP